MTSEWLNPNYDFLSRFYRLTIINIISNILIPLSGLISITFLGHLDSIDILAGVSVANILFGFVYLTFEFLRMSTTGLTAQAVGADDHEQALIVGLRNGLLALVLGLIILIFQHPLREIGFWLLNIYPEVRAAGLDYFDARILGAPAVLINFVLIGWLLGREKNGVVLVISTIGNLAIILLDYVFIVRLGWGGRGAGTSQAIGQYLILFSGLAFASRDISYGTLTAIWPKLLELEEFKRGLALNRDILIRTTTELVVFTLFGRLNAMMSVVTFTQNSLLLQITALNVYLTGGLGFATETLSGNFAGKGEQQKFPALLKTAVSSSLLLTLMVAAACVVFPQFIFALLTSHGELTSNISDYDWWLLLILPLVGVASMLEGFFFGLAQGVTVRNISLISSFFGFLPPAILFLIYHNNQLLWLCLTVFLLVKMAMLSLETIRFLQDKGDVSTANQIPAQEI